jgi:hypothetical protein
MYLCLFQPLTRNCLTRDLTKLRNTLLKFNFSIAFLIQIYPFTMNAYFL